VLLNGPPQPGQIGHVTLNEADLPYFRFRQNQPQPARVFLEVVNPRLIAALQQIANDPGADATVTAGEEDAHKRSLNALDSLGLLRCWRQQQRIGCTDHRMPFIVRRIQRGTVWRLTLYSIPKISLRSRDTISPGD